MVVKCKCGKEYNTDNHKAVPMIGKFTIKKDILYLNDCGTFFAECSCGEEIKFRLKQSWK